MARAGPEDWGVAEIRAYLLEYFPGREIDHIARGKLAELFCVNEHGRMIHQLYVTRKFLDRAPDLQTLLEALRAAEVVGRMRTAGTVTVELH